MSRLVELLNPLSASQINSYGTLPGTSMVRFPPGVHGSYIRRRRRLRRYRIQRRQTIQSSPPGSRSLCSPIIPFLRYNPVHQYGRCQICKFLSPIQTAILTQGFLPGLLHSISRPVRSSRSRRSRLVCTQWRVDRVSFIRECEYPLGACIQTKGR
jgi:hypothetical protein